MKSNTIVFIHGMFMSPLCWEKWIPYCESRGYRCYAPGWPGRDRSVAELRKNHPDPELAKLNLLQVVDYMEKFIKELDEKPILIGHSMGGLIVQILLQRDVAAAAIAINPAPPAGVFSTKFSFWKSNFNGSNPFRFNKPARMSFKHFQYVFANTLSTEVQHAAYDRYVVPESRRVPLSLIGSAGKVDFKKLRQPLLITAGLKDQTIPPSLNKSNFKKYKGPAQTDFIEFPGRDHFLILEPGWEEVAEYSMNWLDKINWEI